MPVSMTETMARRAFNFNTVSQAHRDVVDDRYRDLRRPRKVRFFVNGDRYFKGKKLYITPHRYFNFNDLLNDLTGKLPSNLSLPYGVRQIFTPASGRRVVDIEDLQDGHAYVCAGFEGYKPIKYGKAELEPWSLGFTSADTRKTALNARHHQHENLDTDQNYTQGFSYRPRVYGNAFHPGRYFQGRITDGQQQQHRRYPGAFGPANRNSYLANTENQVPLKPKVITIVRNGPKPRNNVKILLNRRSVQSFEQLMKDISEAFGPKWKSNKVIKLFTTRGREIQGVGDFFRDDDVFIGVGNEQLTESDVHDIIEEIYPDSPYARNIMKDFERQKKKRLAQVAKEQIRDNDADKRDSGFGEGSDGSNRDPDQEYVLYKGRQSEKGRKRNEYPRDLEVAMRLDREKEKAAQDEKDRVSKQRRKMIDSERRAVEEENRRKRQVPRGQAEDPFRKMKEQKEKEKEEIRRRREEERKRVEEDERQRKEEERQRREKDKHDREQAEQAARERQAAAEREKAEKEKERAEKKAQRDREQKEKEHKEKEEKDKHEKDKNEKEKDIKDKHHDREKHHHDKDKSEKHHHDHEKDEKGKVSERENEDEKNKIDNKEKENREAAEREKRKKERKKPRIVRKTKLERQISSDDHVLAKYELGRTLGDGNFAIVRMSKMKATGVEYAMKVIDKPKLKGKEHMVENEIEIMKDCNHPNIVKLYEEYETVDKIYLVMELVKGGDLFDAITQSVKFGEVDAAHMVKDLCSALFYLHSRVIVHRDLKPENLLVHRNKDMTISLKLADFGLAMDVKEAIYTVCGTPTYVAPEILSEIGYGLEVDMWAVGVISYILLCGFPPFRSPDRNQTELFEFIKAGEYEFLSPYWDNISSSAKDLIEHLLVVDKKRRYTAIDVLSHPWILCGGDVSSVDATKIDEMRRASRKEMETQAALNRESYLKMKEKRAQNG
ncbi:serine/threonine-protein kinase DCLK1-like isoform X1 [Mercenaria mercenaria]|uniref:serine/threonine-protein kinase DCLK1-like isoform X1 n=1 Tax=Mercenaria mercenaria TaxID=6596 RepID=UPI00234F41F5|nr:serine/threonine-protein kinase DCLK1-like isoform X1 [Mercenaria mercenaria]XP_053408762.1 serine/threonine-protein kinase DCLK1-like isoform X1 [Mercenaria mercenaria]XP_053408763.1 serine/threonine-protein kinase DCLK1-like isoform X1 [Mercenaria mercenaria]